MFKSFKKIIFSLYFFIFFIVVSIIFINEPAFGANFSFSHGELTELTQKSGKIILLDRENEKDIFLQHVKEIIPNLFLKKNDFSDSSDYLNSKDFVFPFIYRVASEEMIYALTHIDKKNSELVSSRLTWGLHGTKNIEAILKDKMISNSFYGEDREVIYLTTLEYSSEAARYANDGVFICIAFGIKQESSKYVWESPSDQVLPIYFLSKINLN